MSHYIDGKIYLQFIRQPNSQVRTHCQRSQKHSQKNSQNSLSIQSKHNQSSQIHRDRPITPHSQNAVKAVKTQSETVRTVRPHSQRSQKHIDSQTTQSVQSEHTVKAVKTQSDTVRTQSEQSSNRSL